ncbi:MAG: SGNH/GDSL hydrolase family protein, partial [Burkholderiales bacterium]|nr:SGNH/GDSL hydrolase family protein [Burkholderiales bacterium]
MLALSLFPLLLWQGRRTRRITPRVPEAAGARTGQVASVASPADTLRLLALGESPVAGVGVESQQQAITSRFAHHLAQQQQCAVTWQALGKNGATVADAISQLLPHVPTQQQDIVLVAFGVNDTSSFRSVA